MKRLIAALATLAVLAGGLALASSSEPGMPPDDALRLLKEGNARYAAGQPLRADQGPERRAETVKGGQRPIATIIGCSDSRAPLEILFNQGVGDIFVIRVAGNLAGPNELGTVEYGVGHLGAPVLLVLGHTSCWAVTAAVQNAKVHGNITALINQIKPAVAKAKSWSPGAQGDDLLNKAIKANVWLTMENILRKSREVSDRVRKGRLLLVGGIYDLNSGSIAWLGSHPDQGKLLAAGVVSPAAAAGRSAPKPAAKPADGSAEKPAESAESVGSVGSVLPMPSDPHAAPAAPKGQAPAPKAGAAHQ